MNPKNCLHSDEPVWVDKIEVIFGTFTDAILANALSEREGFLVQLDDFQG